MAWRDHLTQREREHLALIEIERDRQRMFVAFVNKKIRTIRNTCVTRQRRARQEGAL